MFKMLILVTVFLISNDVYSQRNNLSNHKKVIVFKSDSKRPRFYRIPSLVTMNSNNALIAFAEERIANGNHDSGDINVVYKISFNHGKTWGKRIMLCELGKDTCGNPTVTVDQKNKMIHVFMNSNKGYKKQFGAKNEKEKFKKHDRRILYVSGSFDKNNKKIIWKKRKDLTKVLQDKHKANFDLVGPGTGIVLMSKKYRGRIVVPADRRFFTSDDQGNTWRESSLLPPGLTSESSITELQDGTIYRNDRMHGSKKGKLRNRRMVSLSHNGGDHISGLKQDRRLYDPVSQGSLLMYTREHIIFANCASTKKRQFLTLRLSNGKLLNKSSDSLAFYKKAILVDNDCGYSSMAKTRNYKIGILYEKVASDSKVHKVAKKAAKDIVFASFKLNQF